MRVLGIETSCDETAVAIVTTNGDRLIVDASLVASQMHQHAEYGGVIPEVAARMHVPVLPRLVDELTGWSGEGIDGIAVTTGPGLSTALRVGIETAKALAVSWSVPLVPVDHIEGHVYASFIDKEVPDFPVLCLIVSGGHTELIRMRGHGQYELVGSTRDDAAGEAFDKTAAQLELPYPGGPSVSKAAVNGNAEAIAFPRPMIDSGDNDMSFSGLKTAVRRYKEGQGNLSDADVCDVAASFQQAVVDVLVQKTRMAAEQYAPNAIVLGGGVSANAALREQLVQAFDDTDVGVLLPERTYTTDNAAMIAAAGLQRLRSGEVCDPFVLDADPIHQLGLPWKWERV